MAGGLITGEQQTLKAVAPALLFGLRLWLSVILALAF